MTPADVTGAASPAKTAAAARTRPKLMQAAIVAHPSDGPPQWRDDGSAIPAATMSHVSQLTPRPELEPDFRDYEPVQPRGTDWRELGRRIWAPFAAIGAFIAKFGVGILKYKFLLGLFISFGAYLWFGGIWFAVGLIGLIFVHEMGHWLEAKRQGLPVSAPLFIPFLGASIFLKEQPQNAWKEFQLAYAGPLLGSLGALGVYAVAVAEDSNRLRAIAFLGFFINLFNLLPVVPLDGGPDRRGDPSGALGARPGRPAGAGDLAAERPAAPD